MNDSCPASGLYDTALWTAAVRDFYVIMEPCLSSFLASFISYLAFFLYLPPLS